MSCGKLGPFFLRWALRTDGIVWIESLSPIPLVRSDRLGMESFPRIESAFVETE